MTGNLGGFDASQHEPNEDVIPAGVYEACIVESGVKPTKDNKGKYLELKLQILNGKHQNRKVVDRLNLWNQSEKAATIAKGTLSSICRAVGVMTPNDSSELHNKPLLINVTVRNDPQYGTSNEVKSYKPRQAGGNGQQAQPAATQGQQPGSPW